MSELLFIFPHVPICWGRASLTAFCKRFQHSWQIWRERSSRAKSDCNPQASMEPVHFGELEKSGIHESFRTLQSSITTYGNNIFQHEISVQSITYAIPLPTTLSSRLTFVADHPQCLRRVHYPRYDPPSLHQDAAPGKARQRKEGIAAPRLDPQRVQPGCRGEAGRRQ